MSGLQGESAQRSGVDNFMAVESDHLWSVHSILLISPKFYEDVGQIWCGFHFLRVTSPHCWVTTWPFPKLPVNAIAHRVKFSWFRCENSDLSCAHNRHFFPEVRLELLLLFTNMPRMLRGLSENIMGGKCSAEDVDPNPYLLLPPFPQLHTFSISHSLWISLYHAWCCFEFAECWMAAEWGWSTLGRTNLVVLVNLVLTDLHPQLADPDKGKLGSASRRLFWSGIPFCAL